MGAARIKRGLKDQLELWEKTHSVPLKSVRDHFSSDWFDIKRTVDPADDLGGERIDDNNAERLT